MEAESYPFSSDTVYLESRLVELFNEHDVGNKGHLIEQEVNTLCINLQLGTLKDSIFLPLLSRTKTDEKLSILI